MRRPAAGIVLMYAAGILCHNTIIEIDYLYFLSTLLFAVFIISAPLRRTTLCILLFFCGWINISQREVILSKSDARTLLDDSSHIARVEGVLKTSPKTKPYESRGRSGENSSCIVSLSRINLEDKGWQSISGDVYCRTQGELPEAFFTGVRVRIEGVIEPVRGPVADGLFDFRSYLNNQGIYHQMETRTARDWTLISPTRPQPGQARFLKWAKASIARDFPTNDPTVRLEWALTLGDKSVLTEETSEPFVAASTFHIFAVDGLRIGILSTLSFLFLRLLRFPRHWCGLISLPIIIFYIALTGWPASAIRALVMLAVVYGGWWLKRPPDLINSLFVAAGLILLYEPRELYESGFQLSFAVVLFIILLMPHFERGIERMLQGNPLIPDSHQTGWMARNTWWLQKCLSLIAISIAAWVASIPLTAQYFHVITPLGFLPNPPAVILCALVLICNLSTLLLRTWLPYPAILLNNSGWFFMKCISAVSSWEARIPGACYNIVEPGWIVIAMYYLLLYCAVSHSFHNANWRKGKYSLWLLIFFIMIIIWASDSFRQTLTVIPCKISHSVFAQGTAFNGNWLLDCGDEATAKSVTKPFLKAKGVNRLEQLILTHPSVSTSGGAGIIVEKFRPRAVYVPCNPRNSATFRTLQSDLKNRGIPNLEISSYSNVPVWKILYPPEQPTVSKAEPSILVMRCTIRGISVLNLPALPHSAEVEFIQLNPNLKSDIVIASTDLDGNALSPSLLGAIQPRFIVLTESRSGETKRQEIRRNLISTGIPVWFTRDVQTVTLEFSENACRIRSKTGDHFQVTAIKE